MGTSARSVVARPMSWRLGSNMRLSVIVPADTKGWKWPGLVMGHEQATIDVEDVVAWGRKVAYRSFVVRILAKTRDGRTYFVPVSKQPVEFQKEFRRLSKGIPCPNVSRDCEEAIGWLPVGI